jgi:hypothetical protein
LEVRPNAGFVGIVGVKGFIGGFADSRMPDFGEPLLRGVCAETSQNVDGARVLPEPPRAADG